MSEAQMHRHPDSGLYLFGVKLGDGDVLQAGDMYTGTSGMWQSCSCPGLTLDYSGERPEVGVLQTQVLWVRPGFEK